MHNVRHQSSQLIACMKCSRVLLNKLLIVNKGLQYCLDLCSSVELAGKVCIKSSGLCYIYVPVQKVYREMSKLCILLVHTGYLLKNGAA